MPIPSRTGFSNGATNAKYRFKYGEGVEVEGFGELLLLVDLVVVLSGVGVLGYFGLFLLVY